MIEVSSSRLLCVIISIRACLGAFEPVPVDRCVAHILALEPVEMNAVPELPSSITSRGRTNRPQRQVPSRIGFEGLGSEALM